jgi:ABC-type amino acid transport substrate-binding protein
VSKGAALNLLLAALVGGVVAFAVAHGTAPKSPMPEAASSQTTFERVTSTHTLRCAYAGYDPFLIIGNDGKITGIFHDVLEEAAKRLNLKVIWAEEVGYGNINTGFMTGRYDAFCAGLWPAGSRAPSTIFSRAIDWDPVSVWVRGNDDRFDGNLEKLNDPAYKIADTDGDATVSMADTLFPKAGRDTVSQNQTIGEEIAQVTTGKADAMFRDYITADKFMKDSPGSLKDLSPGKPPLIYPMTIGYNQKEFALRDMIDVVLGDMERDGTTARIIKQYMGDKSNMLYRKQDQFQPY